MQWISDERKISTDMLVARIIISLSRMEECRENVHKLMSSWNQRENVHYMLTNLFVCIELQNRKDILETAINRYILGSMNEIKQQKPGEYIKNIYEFFAAGVRAFTFYRILIEELYKLIHEGMTKRDRRNICELFLRLFAADISVARIENGEDAIFTKFCYVDHEIRYKICYLWQMVWQCRAYREEIYFLLAKYDAAMYEFGSRYHIEKFVKVALGEVCTKEIQDDICNKIHRRAKK